MTFAEVSRVSKNTAEQRKASQKEKKLRFRQCCCVHLREKREKPSPTLPALAQRTPKYSPEDGLGERHGDKDLRNGRNRSERRGRRGGECVLLFFFLRRRKRASERKRERGRHEIQSRAGPHLAGRSDLFRLFTATMNHTNRIELIRGRGEEGERKRASRRTGGVQCRSSSKLPKCFSKHFERERRNRRPMARPRGGLPASPISACRCKVAQKRIFSRYVVNWRNARARETYLREGEARGKKRPGRLFF